MGGGRWLVAGWQRTVLGQTKDGGEPELDRANERGSDPRLMKCQRPLHELLLLLRNIQHFGRAELFGLCDESEIEYSGGASLVRELKAIDRRPLTSILDL